MPPEIPADFAALRSVIGSDGQLELRLVRQPIGTLAPNAVLVRLLAAPLNPSDLGMLLGPTDPATLKRVNTPTGPVVKGTVPPARLASVAARLDRPMAVGNEAAGIVVAAGLDATKWIGRKVAMFGGEMYAQYRVIEADQCLLLPDAATPAQGASAFVNPLTALGMIETMRAQGHSALVHTAAASNLGQMLNRLCQADEVPLVNIVRNGQQAALLRNMGAKHVCDSTSDGFLADLTDAIATTGATLAFDAIGGGSMAGQIFAAMEAAATRASSSYSRYGSSTFKQVYIYGSLDTGPTQIARTFGMAWGLGGWLLNTHVLSLDHDRLTDLKARVAQNLTTIFASQYAAEVTLDALLDPDLLARAARRATGEKLLIDLAGS
jgi:NADPH:quinone reductase